MPRRPWEVQWDAYKAAEAEYAQAVEEFKLTPAGDQASRAKVREVGRKREAAWRAFGEAFDAEQFRH